MSPDDAVNLGWQDIEEAVNALRDWLNENDWLRYRPNIPEGARWHARHRAYDRLRRAVTAAKGEGEHATA